MSKKWVCTLHADYADVYDARAISIYLNKVVEPMQMRNDQ